MSGPGKAGSLALALLPMAVSVAWRLSFPDDLDFNDQAKQALYVLDIYEAGNWILPREQGYLPATKPPLYAWLAALASTPAGGPTEMTCRLPSVVASLALAGLIWVLGVRCGSPAIGVAAAWIFAATHTALKLCVHVRPDMVLTVLTTGALLALLGEEGESARPNAALFWLAVSLSILTKGPPGPVVIVGGLLVLLLFREERARVVKLLRSPWIALLVLPLLWFVLAIREGGRSYLEGTVLTELSKRAPGYGSGDSLPGTLLVYFLLRAAPWSLLALPGAARLVFGKPPPEARRDLLPLAAWFLPALAAFSVIRAQREDYLLPLLPAVSVLVARALADPAALTERRAWDAVSAASAPAALLLGALALGAAWPPPLGGIPAGARTLWGIALLAAGVLMAWGWRRDRRGGAARITRGFLARAAALLAISLAFQATLSPEARSQKGRDVAEFISQVEIERRAGDVLSFFGEVTNAVRFLTRVNEPSLPVEKLEAAPDPSPPGRRLVITDSTGEAELSASRPGRFSVLLRHPHGRKGPELVLGAWLPAPGHGKLPDGSLR